MYQSGVVGGSFIHSSTDRQTDREADVQTGRQAAGWTDRQTDRQTDREADRQAGSWVDRQTDRQTGRQAGSRTDRQRG